MPIQLLVDKIKAVFSVLHSTEQDATSAQPDTDTRSTDATQSTAPDAGDDTPVDGVTDNTGTGSDTGESSTAPEEQADGPDYGEQAVAVSHAIINELSPGSSLHIGCGAGHHMKPFLDANIDTYGVDPSSVALENAVVPEDLIEIYDLGYPYSPDQPYDVVVCLDTLEYVAERHADIIIESISASGSTAVISIPIAPHRPDPEAWIDKFADHGMELDADTTAQIEDAFTGTDGVWMPDRLLVFNDQ